MAAGIVYHNITTAAGVTFALACWVPDTAAPNVGAVPVSIPVKSDGTLADMTLVQSYTSRLLSAATPVAPATATATTGFNVGGTYNATPITIADTQQAGIQLDAKGYLKTAVEPGSGISTAYYVTVAASQSAQPIQSSTGAVGDYLDHVVVIPATTAPGVVTILDNATTLIGYPGGGTTALLTLTPFVIYVGAVSRSGAWKITTGANVSALAVGKFS